VALTVVLPTPPLPATMTTRDAVKNCAGSTPDSLHHRLPLEALALRRLLLLGLTLATLGAVLGLGAPADALPAAPAASTTDGGRVSIITAQGLIDPVLADFIDRSITAGERSGVVAVVIQLDSPGSVVSTARLQQLARHIHDAEVPVGVWVGTSGAQATGGAAQLAGSARLIGIAPGAKLGDVGDLDVSDAVLAKPFLAAQGRLRSGTVGPDQAQRIGLVPRRRTATILEFLAGVKGFKTHIVKGANGRPTREPITQPVFSALPVQDQLFHTVASPPAAYLLFVIGLSLIIFELFTAGVGVAGLVGAGCFVLSCYGFAVLPVRPIGVALLVLAMLGFSIDVQTGVPRVWSSVGFVALVVGSFTLYDGLSVPWIALLVGIVGVTSAMVAGMPTMVRTRFSTPTIGREWMIGEQGEAVTNVDPDGVVRIRGALWRARTNRATPISLRAGLRVVEVDGLLLEVEPLQGGATDHRERGRGGAGGPAAGDDDVVLVDGKPLDG
jgi:membrane-bound serine protease (ClpP class)